MESMEDFDQARGQAALVAAKVLTDFDISGALADEIAVLVVDALAYDRPDLVYRLAERARRIWYWPRDRQSSRKIWPLVYRGGDEFYNSTIAFRVPFAGTVILALNVPLRRMPIPASVEENPYGKR